MNLDDTYGKWDSTFKELIEVESPLKKKLTISPSYVESDCAFSSYMASSTCHLGIAVSTPFFIFNQVVVKSGNTGILI